LNPTFLKDSGYIVIEAPDDADTLDVKTALDLARTKKNRYVTVIVNDTDILVLLVYHLTTEMTDIFMMSGVFFKASWKI
jgi:Mrp family chromosome partitioning ATPase